MRCECTGTGLVRGRKCSIQRHHKTYLCSASAEQKMACLDLEAEQVSPAETGLLAKGLRGNHRRCSRRSEDRPDPRPSWGGTLFLSGRFGEMLLRGMLPQVHLSQQHCSLRSTSIRSTIHEVCSLLESRRQHPNHTHQHS